MRNKHIIFGLFLLVAGNIMPTNLCHATGIENNLIQQGENQMTQEKGLWQYTKEKTVKAWDKTKEVTSNMWEDTKEFTGDIWVETKEVESDVKQAFSAGKKSDSADEDATHAATQSARRKNAHKDKMMPHRSNRHLQ